MMNTIHSILSAILPFEAYQYGFMKNARISSSREYTDS